MFIQQGQKFSNGLNKYLYSPIQHNSSNIVFGPTTLVLIFLEFSTDNCNLIIPLLNNSVVKKVILKKISGQSLKLKKM